MKSSACQSCITIVLGRMPAAAATLMNSRTTPNALGIGESAAAQGFVPPGYVETLDLESFHLRMTMQRERPTIPQTPIGRPQKRQRRVGEAEAESTTTCCANSLMPLLVLIDAGIRHAISPLPRRQLNGVQVICGDSFQHMAGLAPDIWSPRYREAVASRIKYLPRISHALSSVGCRDVHSPDLREITSKIVRSTLR